VSAHGEGIKLELDIIEIQKLIPHRYPFLLVDKIIDMEVEMTALRRGIGKAETKAYVGEELACSANLTFALI
jgi:3-hydroxymyristoyl/3-hydroxydecanoyl-(acyl carrier protein) dehydratase